MSKGRPLDLTITITTTRISYTIIRNQLKTSSASLLVRWLHEPFEFLIRTKTPTGLHSCSRKQLQDYEVKRVEGIMPIIKELEVVEKAEEEEGEEVTGSGKG